MSIKSSSFEQNVSMLHTWTIVKFIEDNSIEAVPTRWLNGKSGCYWPYKLEPQKLIRAIKNCEPVSDSWEIFQIEIFRNATYDDYSKARKKCKVAEDTSDLNSDIPSDGKTYKRTRKNVKFSSSEESSSDSEVSAPKIKKVGSRVGQNHDQQVKKCPVINLELMNIGGDSSTSKDCEIKAVDNPVATKIPGTSFTSGRPSTKMNKTKEEENQAYLKQILRKLNLLELIIGDLREEIRELKQQRVCTDVAIKDVFEKFTFPLDSEETLVEFENFLKIEDNMEKGIISLSKLGGGNEEDFTKRALKKLMTNKVQSAYSWLGLKQKKRFIDLQIAKLIEGACLRLLSNATQKNVEESIKKYIKRAAERYKLEKK